jgi:hypothetical protein
MVPFIATPSRFHMFFAFIPEDKTASDKGPSNNSPRRNNFFVARLDVKPHLAMNW